MADHTDTPVGTITATGQFIDAATARPRALPPKRWRTHRWIAVASFVLSDEQAEGAYTSGGGKVVMDGSNLWSLGIGCIDCEAPYEDVAGRRCDGETYLDPGAGRG